MNSDGSSGAVTLGDDAGTSPSVPVSDDEGIVEEKKPVVDPTPVEVDASKPKQADPAPITPPPSTETLVANAKETDPSAGYKAYFVRDAIPDGSKLPTNTIFNQTWTLYNPGPCAWPVGSDVRFVGGDTMFNVDSTHPSSVESIRSAMESNKLTAPVAPGQNADFTVTLRTPRREGAAISYWRLKLPNGVPIGHRLWCDVQVQDTVEPVEATKAEPVVENTVEPTGSGMIFPKLEKESPESSTHEAVAFARPAPTVSSHAPTLSTASEKDVLEDVESLTLDDADTDAGFLTDEEYDVLDASDQEFLEAKQSVQ